jgi:hypothetical protein
MIRQYKKIMIILSISPAALQHLNANLCDLLILPFKMVSCVGESSHAGFQQARRGGQFDSGGAATRRVCNLKITKRLPHQRQSADNLITSWRVLALGVIQKTVYTRRTDGEDPIAVRRSSALPMERRKPRAYIPPHLHTANRDTMHRFLSICSIVNQFGGKRE